MRVIGVIYSIAIIAIILTQGIMAFLGVIKLLILISLCIFVVQNINKK